jgi:hypothetical protein
MKELTTMFILDQLEAVRQSVSVFLPVIEYNGNTIRISNLPTLPTLPELSLPELAMPELVLPELPALELPTYENCLLFASTMYATLLLALHIVAASHPIIIAIFFIASLSGIVASYLAMA